MELMIMEQMVLEDHFLRKVVRAVDFSFIYYELCAPLYCADNGQPTNDPEMLFRILLAWYLPGIKSEAWQEEGINDNITYKKILRVGCDRQGAGRDDNQPEPATRG